MTLGYIFSTAYRRRASAGQYLVYLGLFVNTIIAQTQIAYGALLLLALIEPPAVMLECDADRPRTPVITGEGAGVHA